MWHVWSRGGVHTWVWWTDLKGRVQPESLGIDGSMIFKRIFKTYDGGLDLIDLPQDRDRWRVFVNTAMNFRFS